LPTSPDQEIRLLRTSFWSARDPNGRAFAPLAEAFRQQGDLDEAEALLKEGLSRHPTFTTALLVAARVARDRGDLPLAIEYLDRLIHLDGGNVFGLRDRAEARLVEGDREGALRDLREALRLDPESDEIRHRLDALASARAPTPPPVDDRDSEPDFVDRPILTRTMGDIYARQGFLARAIDVYEHLLAENPDDEDLRARLEELTGGPSSDQEEGEAESHAPVAGSRTIAAYFEDLLAWVPGAVPIASLAPGAPKGAASSPDSPLGPSGVEGLGMGGQSKDEIEEFNRWLEGLGR
jgi:tetratricopeptide (TPR) repeat protein